MLKSTFLHIPGIGFKTEQRLWALGLRTWEDFLGSGGAVLPSARDSLARTELERSLRRLHEADYFAERLPGSEVWRLFKEFRNRAVYLDIETSGGYEGFDEITVIGLYDGSRVETFVNGFNLEDFESSIARYDVVVTFNGAGFDLPFIRRTFPGISMPPVHIDLRFLLRRIGLRGGLKSIERKVGLERTPGVEGMNGYHAVLLWAEYQRCGDKSALERLIEYNKADIVNLEPLMDLAYRRLRNMLMGPYGAPR
ncbi:MAG: ribonuclease H-like domain-containing protein [Desulfobacteraceae bacterium]